LSGRTTFYLLAPVHLSRELAVRANHSLHPTACGSQ
jgi:hypothetical protein